MQFLPITDRPSGSAREPSRRLQRFGTRSLLLRIFVRYSTFVPVNTLVAAVKMALYIRNLKIYRFNGLDRISNFR